MTNEIVARALDSNAFQSTDTSAGYITPEVWSRKITEFQKARLVVSQLARLDNSLLGTAGDVIHIQADAELTAAELTESTAVGIQAITYTQVDLTPTEHGVAIEVTRKNLDRSFVNVMEEKAKSMGYSLAKLKDANAITVLSAGAGNSIVANGVALTALAASDLIDTDDLANGVTALRVDEFNGKYLIIHPKQENSFIKDSQFIDASVYGGREVIMNGEIGKYLGIRIFVSTQIDVTSNVATALLIDEDVFVLGQKRNITFDRDYKILERAYQMVAVEDYGFAVIRANGICTIKSYVA